MTSATKPFNNSTWVVGAVALGLYVACWVLPIMDEGGKGVLIGIDGARFAHQAFWDLITGGKTVDSVGEVFGVIFSTIGWLANELFVLGVAVFWNWPRLAVRSFAFSLGIMISWQIVFFEEFPLYIGFWAWVAAGAIVLGLAASRLARQTRRTVGNVLVEPMTVALLFLPILNAAVAVGAQR